MDCLIAGVDQPAGVAQHRLIEPVLFPEQIAHGAPSFGDDQVGRGEIPLAAVRLVDCRDRSDDDIERPRGIEDLDWPDAGGKGGSIDRA
jgi:hypothetical protein